MRDKVETEEEALELVKKLNGVIDYLESGVRLEIFYGDLSKERKEGKTLKQVVNKVLENPREPRKLERKIEQVIE